MCGRFTFMFTWKQLHRLLALDTFPSMELGPRYNVAPTQDAPLVRVDSVSGGRAGVVARWGLVPAWADSLAVGNMMVNARCETLASKPGFRDAFAQRRCVVPISGFYEWRAAPAGRGKGGAGRKQPFYIHSTDGTPLLLAGLWERWTDRHFGRGEPGSDGPNPAVETFTIITCPPNEFMARLHDRMPAILSREDLDTWLDGAASADRLGQLLRPCSEGVLTMHPVSSLVNSPRNEGAELIERREESEPGLFSGL